MSLSSERLSRGRVLHDVDVAPPADMGAVTSRAATSLVVSPELIERSQREGYEAGFNQGYENGYTEGITHAQEHASLLGGLIDRLARAADELATRETTARHQIEDEVVATAFRIAEAIVGRHLEDPETRVRDAIARALKCAPDRGLVTVRLHPADIALIETGTVETGRNLEMVPDPALTPGDCIVDVGACRVDASIESALARVREVLA